MSDAQQWNRIKAVFQAVLERAPHERAEFLRETCGADRGLHAEVRSLLSAHELAGTFVERPAIETLSAEAARVLDTAGRTLRRGDRFGPYEIADFISAGGMGEVYRARDPKLARDVALKILPTAFTEHAERLARFEREARVLAALNHPHIGAIYELAEANGLRALVLELVEGETLTERLGGGPVPVDEALPIARQIADALEAAHEKDIVHRDLKPANIKITPDGVVKVLDFGLAKALSGDGWAPELTNAHAATRGEVQEGVAMGTAAYMSPEQACGKKVDRRTDIWAFGVVVFEMVTGRRPFSGETISETLASVLKTAPDWSALPDRVPSDLRRLLRRCLEKDPKRRLQAIGDARVQIEDLLNSAAEESAGAVMFSPARLRRPVLPWLVVGAISFGLAVVLMLWAPWRTTGPPSAPLRLSVELSPDVSLVGSAVGAAMTLSPDGAIVAFVAQKRGDRSPQLYVRQLDQLQARPLAGTDDADSPFFSPDGQWIAFFAGGKLKKISVTGGAAVTLCDVPDARGGTWAEDGTIVFSPSTGRNVRLLRVSSAGGQPEPLTSLAEGEVTQRWPQALPGGIAVLYTSSHSPGDFSEGNLVVQPLPSGAGKVVQRGGYHGRYLPSGHLVYIHDRKLFAAPFDLHRLELTGQPVPVLEDVASNADTGGAQFAASASGTLVYLPGESASSGALIHWMDRDGKTAPLRVTLVNWSNVLFAPDGRQVAMQIAGPGPSDIWVYDWARDTLTQLTVDPAFDSKPVWTPDGRRIAFASGRADESTLNLYWQRADGTGGVQRLTESKNQQRPASWHKDAKFLAFEEQNPTTSWDLMILPMEANNASDLKLGKPWVFLNTPSAEREPMFSPDGQWLAYHSYESGRNEVYVRPFPGPGGKSQISTGGGTYPTWSRTENELFYSVDGQIMVAPFAVEGDTFRAQKPRLWSDGRYLERPGNRGFDLHPDGDRLAVAVAPAAQTRSDTKRDKVVFIFNFVDELRQIAPATKR